MDIRSCEFAAMHIAPARIHARVAFHAETALLALLALAHFRIALSRLVLGRTWSLDKSASTMLPPRIIYTHF